jgi:RNA polymerase sigma-70 factor (ECF subfamily)
MSSAPLAATAFERDVLPHLDLLYRVALRLTGEAANAEDLVQDTVLKAFRAWDSFRQGTNARGWLLTILRNTFINDYRRRRRTPVQVDLDVAEQHALIHEESGHDPEGEFFHALVDDRILAAIDALPEEFREVVVLSDIEGLGYAQIAETLGVPVGTVKSRLSRARRQLQGTLLEYAVEAGIVRPGKDA